MLSLPHARGGVSQNRGASGCHGESSPRTWGCFSRKTGMGLSMFVFPTHVGVFPPLITSERAWGCLPHARGGVSTRILWSSTLTASSPRTWGCFHTCLPLRYACLVFPTHVGVFLRTLGNSGIQCCLPHARGGVSITVLVYRFYLVSSPRTWGCFYTKRCIYATLIVFPTHVGVFLKLVSLKAAPTCLPHARGGVSRHKVALLRHPLSSPRTWRCFSRTHSAHTHPAVFPTHVGVFPVPLPKFMVKVCLPHARGGGAKQGLPPKAPSPQLGLFTSALDIDSFIWRE